MAIITSAGTGNFSATTTWIGGVVPIDGDNFIINPGHVVTIDASTPIPTNGFNDSTVNGTLQHAASGTTTLRMNGRLTVQTNGLYFMRGSAILEFRGSNTDSHGLWINGQSGASFIATGADGMRSTTLSSNINEGSTSLTVANATGFAVGEWIAVYNNTTAYQFNQGAHTLRDEGFWIHDIDGNTIYFRQYVGPTATISLVRSGNTELIVSNAKVFRTGQKIIFGTGVNRNIRTINSIDYNQNLLTLDSAVTGTVTGLTIYETGTDKVHASGDKVRKVATITTASATSTSTTITVADASNFAAGDEIWIEARSECGGTTDVNWNTYETIETIQSVSGNTITLTAQVGYNVVQGALVTRLTRNVQIRTVTNSDHGFIFFDYFVGDGNFNNQTNFNRKLIMKDVYCRRMGTSASGNERGITFRGWCSTDALPVTIPETVPALGRQNWIEGVTLNHTGQIIDIAGFFPWDCRYTQLRCCFVTKGFDGFATPWYSPGQCVYNSISTGCGRFAMRSEGGNEWYEVAYNYLSRNYHQLRVIQPYEDGLGYHHIITDACNEYGYMTYNSSRGLCNYKHIHTGTRLGIVSETSFNNLLYSVLRFPSGVTSNTSNPPGTAQTGAYYLQIDRGNIAQQAVTILEDNFEYDRVRQFGFCTERVYDNVEEAWRVYNRFDYVEYGTGWGETVFVPAGTTLRVSCRVKMAPGYTGNYPYLEARSTISNVGINQISNAGGQWSNFFTGGTTTIQYSASSLSAYEERQLTVNPVNFPRYIQVGVHGDSTNTARGWWMKDIQIYLDRPYINPAFGTVNGGASPKIVHSLRSSFTELITRIGGRFN